MSKKDEVRCVVLGNSDGPNCSSCSKPMDTVKVKGKKHKLAGKTGHYCYPCTEAQGAVTR